MVPREGSPLVDAGDDTKNEEETDIIGNIRMLGAAIDIGAYEAQASLDSHVTDLSTSTIHPNPATYVLNIEVDGAVDQIIIYSLSGDKILSQKIQGRKKLQLDISNLPSGIYIISTFSDQGSSQQKLIKY